MKLLHIDSSGRRNSASRHLTSQFVARWKREYPDGEVTQRDLAAEAFSSITDDWVSATRVPSPQWTEQQREAMARSDVFVAELIAADIIVIGAPMRNFTISWPLKAWIDQIVRVGKTLVYGEKGPRGVLEGKRVVVISSRGGSRRPATHPSHIDFLDPYLRAVLGFVGLTDVTFIHAENQYRPDQARGGRAAALLQIEQTIAGLGVAFPPNSANEYATDAR